MKIYFVPVLVCALAIPVPGLAQQASGDTELQIQGSLNLGGKEESGSVYLSYGRFFSDRQEAGLSVTGYTISGDLAGFGGPFYRYNFSNEDVVPYVGAAAGSSFGDFAGGDLLLTFEGGIRFFLSRNSAFSVAAVTNYSVEESEVLDGLNLVFGFSYLWGK